MEKILGNREWTVRIAPRLDDVFRLNRAGEFEISPDQRARRETLGIHRTVA
jgi:hypothetical protein